MASGLSSLDRTEHAARQAFEQAAEQLPQGPTSANIAFVFFSSAHVGQAGLVASAARAELPNATIVGCSAESVVGGAIELEDRPGISVLACSMPGTDVRAFGLSQLAGIDPGNPHQVERVRDQAGMTHEHSATFLFPDPFGLPTGRIMNAIDKASRLGLADSEHPTILGGLASAENSAGGSAFLLDGQVIRDGGVGLSINGPVTVDTVVSQGCRPLGPNLVVTEGRGNIVARLGGRPAFETIREIIADLEEDEKQMLSKGVFLGVVADEHKRHFGRGDYVIRSIMSANESDGSIALSDYVRLGQTVRLHARDANTAHEDLELLLDAQKLHEHPAGSLLVTCNGRGTKLFDQPNHDAATVRRAFEAVRKGTPTIGAAPHGVGQPMPIAGFFAAGEIGPIQGRTFLHGHTACVALFRGQASCRAAMPTLLCVPITVDDPHQALQDADHARLAGADLVEFRLDAYFDGDDDRIEPCVQLIEKCLLPCIATCRPTWEGGDYDGDDSQRISLFERLGTTAHPPRYIDVELAAYTRSMNLRQKVDLAVAHEKQERDLATGLILSMHDFEGRPSNLTRQLLALRDQRHAAVHKIAFRARSLRDNLELFEILKHRDRPTIALGMGRFGLLSRVLAPKFGALLTFASLRPEANTAPGQPTITDLRALYRFENITKSTKVFGVVGDPVEHSRSPAMHNAGFERVGFDGVYLPMPVAPGYESLKATLTELLGYNELDLMGLSVTMPHKENLVRLAREQGWALDALAERANAANTLSRDGSSVRISNTDGPAVVSCLERSGVELHGAPVLVLGAGGMARSCAFALADAGAIVHIWNRTPERAQELADAVPNAVHATSPESAHEAAAIVHCTPVGMAEGPAPEGSPIDLESFHSAAIVETVYHPLETPLVRNAIARGLRAIDGLDMLVEQASSQFKSFTGHAAPTELFREAARVSG